MNQIDWKRKLSFRKLWAAIAGIVTGLAMVFGLDESTISSVAGAVVSVICRERQRICRCSPRSYAGRD